MVQASFQSCYASTPLALQIISLQSSQFSHEQISIWALDVLKRIDLPRRWSTAGGSMQLRNLQLLVDLSSSVLFVFAARLDRLTNLNRNLDVWYVLSTTLNPRTTTYHREGFNNGVISGCVVLPSFHRDFNLPPKTSTAYTTITANIVSFLQIGALAGSFLVFPIVKHLGRRWALVSSGVMFFIGSAMQVSLLSIFPPCLIVV